jgi:hypothetical protein
MALARPFEELRRMTDSIRTYLIVAAIALATLSLSSVARAEGDYCGPYSVPDIFGNYYVPPVACSTYPGAVGAQLYVSPRPVPPWVGHTYITYPPLMPHEFLYHHRRTYYRGHGPHGGLTRTSVWWH